MGSTTENMNSFKDSPGSGNKLFRWPSKNYTKYTKHTEYKTHQKKHQIIKITSVHFCRLKDATLLQVYAWWLHGTVAAAASIQIWHKGGQLLLPFSCARNIHVYDLPNIGVARILSAGVHFFTTQQKLLKIDSCSGWGALSVLGGCTYTFFL